MKASARSMGNVASLNPTGRAGTQGAPGRVAAAAPAHLGAKSWVPRTPTYLRSAVRGSVSPGTRGPVHHWPALPSSDILGTIMAAEPGAVCRLLTGRACACVCVRVPLRSQVGIRRYRTICPHALILFQSDTNTRTPELAGKPRELGQQWAGWAAQLRKSQRPLGLSLSLPGGNPPRPPGML